MIKLTKSPRLVRQSRWRCCKCGYCTPYYNKHLKCILCNSYEWTRGIINIKKTYNVDPYNRYHPLALLFARSRLRNYEKTIRMIEMSFPTIPSELVLKIYKYIRY